MPVYALLGDVRNFNVYESALYLIFDDNYGFAKTRLSSPETIDYIQNKIREYQERELKKRIKKEIKKQEDYKDMFEDLKEIICEYVDVAPETIKEDSRFIEDLGFNSYDFMSMVGEIEEKFDVEVEEREVVNVKTVKDAVAYIQSLQAE